MRRLLRGLLIIALLSCYIAVNSCFAVKIGDSHRYKITKSQSSYNDGVPFIFTFRIDTDTFPYFKQIYVPMNVSNVFTATFTEITDNGYTLCDITITGINTSWVNVWPGGNDFPGLVLPTIEPELLLEMSGDMRNDTTVTISENSLTVVWFRDHDRIIHQYDVGTLWLSTYRRLLYSSEGEILVNEFIDITKQSDISFDLFIALGFGLLIFGLLIVLVIFLYNFRQKQTSI
ncbi:MAG: hypothetical protein ACFE95_15760 [Candidatus Hodarchaeota archaeon]